MALEYLKPQTIDWLEKVVSCCRVVINRQEDLDYAESQLQEAKQKLIATVNQIAELEKIFGVQPKLFFHDGEYIFYDPRATEKFTVVPDIYTITLDPGPSDDAPVPF